MPRVPAVAADALRAVRSALAGDPLLVAAILLALFVAAVALGWVHYRRTRPPGERFRRMLADQDTVAVLMHPDPDPDAMASAVGVAHFAELAGTEVDIHYSGRIGHQENRAFQTVFDLDFRRIEDATDLSEGPVVLVDHNEPRGFEGAEAIRPFAVIDHHPGDGTGTALTDVRPEYGACATVLAEYLADLGIGPTAPEEAEDGPGLPSSVATGLLYGILADTNDLTRGCSPAEFDAAAYLYPGVDEEALDRIANPPVDAEVLEAVAAAIVERDVRGPFVVSDVGEVSNADVIPQAADELLRLEGVTAVVVVGTVEDTLHLSGRSRDDRVHMGETLQAAVEGIPMSGAGGHARMGGGQVSVTHLEGLRPDSGMSREEFRDRLFAALQGEIDPAPA